MPKPLTEKKIQIPDDILKKLLTKSEIRMLKNRFMISNLLEEGLSIRKIAEKVKVGTDTVVRTIRLIDKIGLKNKSAPKRKMNKFVPPALKSSTPWIFGKSNE